MEQPVGQLKVPRLAEAISSNRFHRLQNRNCFVMFEPPGMGIQTSPEYFLDSA
jgi:hypothetical protein